MPSCLKHNVLQVATSKSLKVVGRKVHVLVGTAFVDVTGGVWSSAVSWCRVT